MAKRGPKPQNKPNQKLPLAPMFIDMTDAVLDRVGETIEGERGKHLIWGSRSGRRIVVGDSDMGTLRERILFSDRVHLPFIEVVRSGTMRVVDTQGRWSISSVQKKFLADEQSRTLRVGIMRNDEEAGSAIRAVYEFENAANGIEGMRTSGLVGRTAIIAHTYSMDEVRASHVGTSLALSATIRESARPKDERRASSVNYELVAQMLGEAAATMEAFGFPEIEKLGE